MQGLLIVGDDATFASLLARFMRVRVHCFEVVEDLAAAFSKARAFTPEHVIIDLNLKEEDGADLIPEVLEVNRRARIIVNTSYSNFRSAARAVRLAAADVIAKPLTIEEIEHALKVGRGTVVAHNAKSMDPNTARDAHIVEFFQKNGRNVFKAARVLDMHRRTLQRLLKKSKITLPVDAKSRTDSAFGRARRLARLWSLVMWSNIAPD